MAETRGRETVGDLLRSLVLVLLAVAVVFLLTLRPHGGGVQLVDYRATLVAAGPTAPFALVAPVGLPEGWRATSAAYDGPGGASRSLGTTWHVGFLTPDQQYAGFEQTDGSPEDVLRDVLQDARDEGSSATIAGRSWRRWDDGSAHRALVSTDGRVSIVVDGSAGWADLERLAGSLQAKR